MLCTTFLWKFGAEDVCLHFLYLYVPSSWYIYLPKLFSWVYLPTFLPTTWTNSHSFFQFYLFTCISFVIYLWNTQVKLFLFVLNYKCWKNEWKDSSHGLRYQRQTSNHCATCLGLISYVVANLLFIRLFLGGGLDLSTSPGLQGSNLYWTHPCSGYTVYWSCIYFKVTIFPPPVLASFWTYESSTVWPENFAKCL